MTNTRDDVINGTANMEGLLSAYGARGNDFGGKISDLEARHGLPKRVLEECLAASRVHKRLLQRDRMPEPIEVFVWSTGISALMAWLEAQPPESSASRPKTGPAEKKPVARKRTFRVEPWMIIAAAVMLGSMGALAFHAAKLPASDLLGSGHRPALSLLPDSRPGAA